MGVSKAHGVDVDAGIAKTIGEQSGKKFRRVMEGDGNGDAVGVFDVAVEAQGVGVVLAGNPDAVGIIGPGAARCAVADFDP